MQHLDGRAGFYAFSRGFPTEAYGARPIGDILCSWEEESGKRWAMGKSKIIAATLAISMAFSSPTAFAGIVVPPPAPTSGIGATGFAWAIFGCSGGIIFAALVKNFQFNKPLTPNEAATCGLLFWFNLPPH